MLTGIALFEWRYATRRLTFAAAALLFAGLGFALASTSFGADDIPVNAPYAIAYSTGFLALLSVFAVAVIVGPALLRDAEHQMTEIVYATAVTRTEYLVGRLAGSLLAAFVALLAGLAGMAAATLRHEPDRVVPLNVGDYAWAAAVMALPSMAFVGALLFVVAALTRRSLATYVAGVCVYVAYLVTALFTSSPILASSGPVSPEDLARAALLDPFGLSALFDQTRYWTPAERAVQRVALTGRFLANRVIWSAAAVALVALARHLFRFRVPAPPRRLVADDAATTAVGRYRPVPGDAGSWWPALASTLGIELRALARSWPLAAILVVWAATCAIEVSENLRSVEYGTALWPTAGLLVDTFQQPLQLFGLLVVVFFSAEVVWRERLARAAEVVDATPAPSGLFVAAKVAALAVLVLVMVLVPIAVGLAAQVVLGQRPLEPAVLLSLLHLSGLPLVLVAVLAVLLQTLAPQRHVGLLLTLAAAVLMPLGGPGGPDHPLLRYAWIGAPKWSDLAGFGSALRVALAFLGYWTALAVVLALAAVALWRRGTDTRLAPRFARAPRALARGGRVAAAVAALAFLALGALLFRETNVVRAWETGASRTAWKADYERRYAYLRDVPQPRVTHLHVELDLFPDDLRARLRGRWQLRNDTGRRVPEVHVATRRDVRTLAVSIDGRPAARTDTRFGQHVFDVAIEPDAGAELAFELEIDRSGTSPATRLDLAENGSFVFGPLVLPSVGYRASYEIEDPEERRRQGLGVRASRAGEPELVTFELIVGTPADQTAVAPGVLRETRKAGGRRWTRFVAERPVQPVLAVAAARYAVQRTRRGGVDVEVFHHPGHERNVPRALEAAASALEDFSRRFGAYPWPQLRVAEIPAHHVEFAGFAVPGAVFFTEDRGFLTDLRDPDRVDILTKRVAHEVAHQWWGHQVTPPTEPGASAVVESLARHSELLALRRAQGPAAVTAALQVELDRYLSGRAREPEVPLDQVEDQAWLYYAKGALVMHALQELAGEAAVDAALRALVDQAKGGGPAPTAGDLVRHLRAALPPAHHARLDELFSRVVLDDVRVASASAEPSPGGWRVTGRLTGTQLELADGRERARPFDDTVELAVYGSYPAPGTAPLRVVPVRVSGAGEFVVEGVAEPAYVAVDPRLLRIDRNPEDNVRKVEIRR